MKTLQQIHQEKLIDEIFPSFSKEHQAMILKIIQRNEKEWLTQKRQELIDLSTMKDPYNDVDRLLSAEAVENFTEIVNKSIEAKVLEIYHIEQELKLKEVKQK